MSDVILSDFDALYRDFYSKIQAYIGRRVSDPFLIEDLTADVFCKAMAATERGVGAGLHAGGWLYRIAHNHVIDYYRERDRHRELPIEDFLHLPDPDNDPVIRAERAQVAEMVRSAMKRLSSEQAQVMEMRYIDGYTIAEIALALGKTEGAAKQLAARALVAANDFLRSGVARPKRTPSCINELIEALREHGPMAVREVGEMIGSGQGAVWTAINANPDTFARTGTRYYGTTEIFVFGLREVHDKEAA